MMIVASRSFGYRLDCRVYLPIEAVVGGVGIGLGDSAAVGEMMVTGRSSSSPPTNIKDRLHHRQLAVVTQDRLRHTAKESKCRNMVITKNFRRLSRKGLHKDRITEGQVTCAGITLI